MANVSWTDPGTSGAWSVAANWTGLVGESYPGESVVAGDTVAIDGTNGAYIVTVNVSATLSSLAIEGGKGTNSVTTLRMLAGNTLTILGSVELRKQDEPAAIDGAGTILVSTGITATGAIGSEGKITAGTDTTGGVLELTGDGFISSPFIFAIGTTAPTTLEFNMKGGVITPFAITIDDANQTLEVGPLGSVVIQAAQNVTNGTIVMAGGTLSDNDGLSFGTKTSNGSLSGFGTVIGALTVSGTGTANTITAIGGNLTLDTAIGENSGLVYAIGSTPLSALQLEADPGDGNTFTFLGSDGELALTSSASKGFDNAIVGLNVGSTLTPTNVVHILDETVTVVSGQFGFGTTGTVELSDGAILHLSSITGPSGNWFVQTASDGAGGTDVFLSTVCFVAGTRILTPTGERTIESLLRGDIVLTLSDGRLSAQPVRWVGHRRIDLVRHPRPETVAPIRIEHGAFADNVPHRDLLVSPDHAIFVDGMLICARQLVNGSTIRREKGGSSVDYYHVELDEHAILLAEGLPTESYLDTGNRGFFANAGPPLVLHPNLNDEAEHPTREANACAPFVWDEASVRPVWQRLADRVANGEAQRVTTTTDAALRLVADRRRVKPVFSDGDHAIFVLPRGASEIRLVSRAQPPTEARPWLNDRRQLGVRVKRIVLRSADETWVVPMDHPDLTRGWWAIERDGLIMSRWTDGEAVLPLPSMRDPVLLEIHLSGAMVYAEDTVPEDVAVKRAA